MLCMAFPGSWQQETCKGSTLSDCVPAAQSLSWAPCRQGGLSCGFGALRGLAYPEGAIS